MSNDSCIFCKIIKGQIPSRKIYEDDELLAFYDINARAPVHFLVIPKQHITDITQIGSGDIQLTGKLLVKASELAVQLGLGEKGFRIVNNCKSDGGQTVEHLHLHILGGRQLGWPPG